ncbi:MAG TPA: ATP-binding protein [Candidatus Sulfotelmatobacter sp.]|nr:ATP-binding protein [Candidatus Sulfotelmatobacter sp.]
MTESAKSENEVPIETSILRGAVPLESILCTDELHRRPSRLPDYEKENHALVVLVSALADSPLTILQALAETILDITQSDSAGLSLLTKDVGGQRFYWPAIAGVWKPHVGGGTPRNFGPCGDVLDCNRTLLFKHFERRYPYLIPVMPPAEECLLVPFYVGGKAVGTIWAIMHSDRRKFDAEDDRVMGSLGKFASSAYQALVSIDDLKFQVAEREKAETQLRELTDGLERQVRVRTEELELRNRQLAEAQAGLAEEKLALERSEAYLAEAQRLSQTGSWHWNISTGEVFWSKEFFAIFGFDSEKDTPSHSSFVERIHPEERSKIEEARWAAIREKKRIFEAEYRILLPGDVIKYVRSLGHCAVGQSGDVEFIGTIMDITERKRAEEERERLRHALAELTHINRVSTMGELTASLAHEIKQPIAAAAADAETCLLWLTRDQPDVAEAQAAASRLMKDVTHASDIINRIGLLFRKDVPQRELVDVNGVIQEMIALLRSEASRYSISIHSELANGLPKIMADRVALQQVFMNLMLNGIEAMKDMAAPGKLTITSRQTENRELLVLVSDTGVGLRPERAEQVFNPFYTSKPQGTGMGLPIGRSIIESHGGRLWVTSTPGPGATFQFTLPIEVAAHGP